MVKVSVIVPTYNSWSTLKGCIQSLQKQSLKPHEIIIVDNSSTDGTFKNAKKSFPGVRLVRLNKNSGVTGGRNRGIKEAGGKPQYILFFDHDMVADTNMIKELVDVAKSRNNIKELYHTHPNKLVFKSHF